MAILDVGLKKKLRVLNENTKTDTLLDIIENTKLIFKVTWKVLNPKVLIVV